MTKITISLNMDDKFDIVLLNKSTKKQKEIKFSNKNINAYDIYELLDYKTDNNYEIISNIDKIPEGNERDYFNEVINLIDGIKREINELNENGQDIEVHETQDTDEDLLSDLD